MVRGLNFRLKKTRIVTMYSGRAGFDRAACSIPWSKEQKGPSGNRGDISSFVLMHMCLWPSSLTFVGIFPLHINGQSHVHGQLWLHPKT